MPNLLLFGNFYAPEHTGIAPYTTQVAEHMASIGWGVTVICGMPHYPQWRVQEPYRRRFRAREERQGVQLLRVRQYVPARQSALGRALYEATFFGHALTQVRAGPADCVVGVVPGIGGGAAGALAARRRRVPFGLIVQDLIGQAAAQSGMPGGGLAAKPARAVEGWMVRQAHRVAVIAESVRPYLERAGVAPELIVHLPNWAHVVPPHGSGEEVRRSLGWPEGQKVVLHAGNMGFKQNLGAVVEAAKLAERQGLPVHFVLMGDGNERRRLEELAAGVGSLRFLDAQPAERFMDVLAAADVLLLNERPSVLDMSLPSKITSYFLAGRPVVAAVAAGGATEAELRSSGGALVSPAGDAAALLGAIRSVTDDDALADRLVRAAREHAERNFERTALLRRSERFITDLEVSGRR
jgi:glycosyltransferase involved in cell wall biosynthesis